MRLGSISVLSIAAAAVCAAPLLGLALAGVPLAGYLALPPRATFVPQASFEWSWFAALSLPVAGAAALYWIAIAHARPETAAQPRSRFPWWGWLGLGLCAGGWYLAWHGGGLPPEWRRDAFTPLWFGYVLAINGLAYRRFGWSLLTHRSGWFIALFPASAGFWWLFEYLNQFVGNWHYAGAGADGAWDYFLRASLPFSTVLPAVAGTWSWLRQFPRLDAMALPALRGHAAFARLALPAGVLALASVGVWPEALFPMLWVAPLLVLWSLQELMLGETLLTPGVGGLEVAGGNFRTDTLSTTVHGSTAEDHRTTQNGVPISIAFGGGQNFGQNSNVVAYEEVAVDTGAATSS